MKLLSDLSLKSKLIVPIIVFTGIIFIASQGYVFYNSFETQKGNLIDRVSVLAKGVAYNLQAAILFDDGLGATEVLDAFEADDEVYRVKLYTSDGQLFAMYERKDTVAPVPTELQRKEIALSQYSIANDYIFLLVPVEVENETIAHLRVTISKGSFEKLYTNALMNSLVFFLLLTVAGVVLYMTVQKYIVGPVYSLNLGMRSFIDRKQTTINVQPAANDEIGDLVNAFNTMLERLSQRDQQVAFTLGKLEEEKSFANEVVETVKHALIVVDAKGEIIHFNPASCDIFRCTAAYLKGAKLVELIHEIDTSIISHAISSSEEFTDEQIWVKDVFSRNQQLNITSTKLSKVGQVLFAIQDITEVEAALRRQRLAAGVFENSQDGLMVTDDEDVITMVNPAVTRLLGFNQESLLGKKAESSFAWQQFSSLMPTIKESVDNYGQWQGEIWEQHLSGHKVPMFVKVSRIASSDGSNRFDYVYILSDLSSLKEMERLEYLAHHDSLTGLANRAKLYRVLDETLLLERDGKDGIALLYLDLDGFKGVNDTFGHDAGDEVLKQVAERLLAMFSSQDLVARLSGDEFVVLVENTTAEAIASIAQQLIDVIQRDIVYKGRVLQVGASVGIQHSDAIDRDLDQWLKAADTAMYQAKTQGKGQFVLHQS